MFGLGFVCGGAYWFVICEFGVALLVSLFVVFTDLWSCFACVTCLSLFACWFGLFTGCVA